MGTITENSLRCIAIELERIRRVLEKIERRLEHEEEITRGGRAELPAESEG